MTENRPRALKSILMNSFSLMIRYLREKNYEESARETLLYAIVKPIFFGSGESDGEQKEEDPVDIEAVKCPGKQREVACLKNDLIIKAMKLCSVWWGFWHPSSHGVCSRRRSSLSR